MLDINPTLLGMTIVLFIVMIVFLNMWLYKPMLSYMESRDASIKNDLAAAGSTDTEVKGLNDQAQAIIEEAKAEAAALRAKVLEDAKTLAASKLEARRNELDSEYKSFEKDLEKERDTMKSSLLSQTPLFKEALKAKFSQI
ncbi:MAG: F0F1 ATP synthase subunit B' [Thiovulaceae bacterium]|nr:F0F1 ATP synthase subunit B' [Sulfurimonadaceae bacterium]